MLTPEARELRRDRLGSSDTPAVLGVDPFWNAHDVYADKVFGTKDVDNSAIRMGNLFEAALVAWAAEQLGIGDVEANVSLAHSGGILGANLDGLSRKARCVIEAKWTGMAEGWGEEGTDQLPERVLVQTLHQVECCSDQEIEVDLVWVPVMLARYGRPCLELFRVPRFERGQKAIVAFGHNFWREHVVPRRPPTHLLPSLETLSRVRRQPHSVAHVSQELVDAYETAKALRKSAEDATDEAKRALLAAGGNAEALDFGHMEEWYTYFEQARAGVNVKKLRTQRPEIFAAFDSTSHSRILRRVKR